MEGMPHAFHADADAKEFVVVAADAGVSQEHQRLHGLVLLDAGVAVVEPGARSRCPAGLRLRRGLRLRIGILPRFPQHGCDDLVIRRDVAGGVVGQVAHPRDVLPRGIYVGIDVGNRGLGGCTGLHVGVVIPGDGVHGHEDFQSVVAGRYIGTQNCGMVPEPLQQLLPVGAVGLQVVKVQHDGPGVFPQPGAAAVREALKVLGCGSLAMAMIRPECAAVDEGWEQAALGTTVPPVGLMPDSVGIRISHLPFCDPLGVIGQKAFGQGWDGLVQLPNFGDEPGKLAVPDFLQDAAEGAVAALRIDRAPVNGDHALQVITRLDGLLVAGLLSPWHTVHVSPSLGAG